MLYTQSNNNVRNGYTIIELIIIIIIVSILGAIAFVKLPVRSKMNLRSATGRMARDIRYVRNAAITRQQTYGIKFNPGANTYAAYQGNFTYGNIIDNPATGESFIVDFSNAYAGIELDSTSLAGDVIQFDSKGIPQDASGLIDVFGQIILYAPDLSQSANIWVMPNTGMVKSEP
ncbi:GspH/FimT family pseudopilin [Candidatus Margulisiibacteriota bacterium]